MIKKIILALFLLALLSALIWVYPAYRDASNSARLWQTFQSALTHHDTAKIKELLADAEFDLHEIKGDSVLYMGMDYTDRLIQERPRFRKMVEYYLFDPRRKTEDKVFFPDGYATINQGKIIFLKFP